VFFNTVNHTRFLLWLSANRWLHLRVYSWPNIRNLFGLGQVQSAWTLQGDHRYWVGLLTADRRKSDGWYFLFLYMWLFSCGRPAVQTFPYSSKYLFWHEILNIGGLVIFTNRLMHSKVSKFSRTIIWFVVFLLQQVDFLDSSGRIETEPVKLLVIGYIRKLQSAVITFY
jgi:hypothetical protein